MALVRVVNNNTHAEHLHNRLRTDSVTVFPGVSRVDAEFALNLPKGVVLANGEVLPKADPPQVAGTAAAMTTPPVAPASPAPVITDTTT